MRYPFVWLAFCFCLGIFAAKNIHCPFLLIYFAALFSFVLILSAAKRTFLFGLFLSLFAFLFGALLLRYHQVLPKCHIVRQLFDQGTWPRLELGQCSLTANKVSVVEGVIRSQPIYKFNSTIFLLEARKIESGPASQRCCGIVLAKINGKKELRYDDIVMARGNLYKPYRNTAPGNNSYREYLARQGIYCLMHIRSPYCIKILGNNNSFSPQALALGLKSKVEGLLFKYVSPVPASILDAMILGERKSIPPLVNLAMMKTGTVHILVVSGFNTSLVIFVIMLLLKILRLSRKLRIAIALPLIILYCLMTGASTPVVRATVMSIIFLSAYTLKREGEIYNSCALALVFILLVNPLQLFDIGLQLSFASVLAISYLYPKIKALLRIENPKNRFARFLLEGSLVSCSAWIGTMGIVAYYFGLFSPVTVLANMFIVPLATLITLSGVALVFISVTLPGLAPYFAATSEMLVSLLLWTNHLLLQIPFSCFKFS
ncbi:MAG: ComEC/Rec2 family competence protein [Candidatus Omnitrophica bacterium]|nr:ComEC/Rec2 family competence protein [Candidatus Omnitrophota bacterium]